MPAKSKSDVRPHARAELLMRACTRRLLGVTWVIIDVISCGEYRLSKRLASDLHVLSDWFLFCDTAFRVSPPLTITDDEIRESAALIIKVLDRLN
jgi:hypothetical protein